MTAPLAHRMVLLAACTLGTLSFAGCPDDDVVRGNVPVGPPAELTYLPAAPGAAPDTTTFTRWSAGHTAFVAPDGANLRAGPSIESDVVTELPLGTSVTIVKAAGAPTRVLDRVDVWYEVRVPTIASPDTPPAPEPRGFLFGNTLTPLGLSADLDKDGEDEVVTVAFTAGGLARVRVREPGIDHADRRVRSADLSPVRGNARGGALTAAIEGDLVAVTWCRDRAGGAKNGRDCEVLRAAYRKRGAPAPGRRGTLRAVQCTDCRAPLEAWSKKKRAAVLELSFDYVERAPTVLAPCAVFGEVRTGKHAGKELVMCAIAAGEGKDDSDFHLSRYVRASPEAWVWLPRASSTLRSDIAAEAIKAKGIALTVDATTRLLGLGAPEVLFEDDRGAVVLRRHARLTWNPDEMEVAFFHPQVGPVYRPKSGAELASLAGHAATLQAWNGFFVPDHHDGTLLYGYRPNVWKDPAIAEDAAPYASFGRSCAPTTNVLYAPTAADAEKKRVTVDGMKPDVQAWALTDPAHPLNRQAFATWRGKQEPGPIDMDTATREPKAHAAFLATVPQVFIQDSFDRWLRLRRKDVTGFMGCEPIVYLYPPAPTDVRVTLAPSVSVTAAAPPPAANTWRVRAQPSGALIDDGGHRADFLFYEGRPARTVPAPAMVTVASRDVRAALSDAASARGLRGREREEFVAAWAPRLAAFPAVELGFHNQRNIEIMFPLEVEPRPDVAIRVMLDWRPLDAVPPRTVREVPGPQGRPPARSGFTLVEWGGLVRSGAKGAAVVARDTPRTQR